MSIANAARFLESLIDEKGPDALDGIDGFEALADRARQDGYEVTASDLRSVAERLESQLAEGAELTDEDLEQVSGGISASSFSTMSNVMKTQHDTAMSTIRNIR